MEWKGLENYRKYLASDLPNAFEESVIEALNETAIDAKARAKELVAVDTGSLQKSIRRERFARPAGKIVYTGIRAGGYVKNPKTGRLVDYAGFQEYGTSRMRPRPFMRPALKWASKKTERYFWQALSRRVNVR